MSRHSFGTRWTDAPSIQPERVPAHRAGRHVADRHEDSCSLVCEGGWEGGVPCAYYAGRRRVGAS